MGNPAALKHQRRAGQSNSPIISFFTSFSCEEVKEPIFDAARAAGKENKIGQLNPLRRGGQPVEIANAAVFLARDESSYINGQSIAVDGGLSSSHPFVPGRIA